MTDKELVPATFKHTSIYHSVKNRVTTRLRVRRFYRFWLAMRPAFSPENLTHICRNSSRLTALVCLMLIFEATPGLFGQTAGVLTNLAQVKASS